MAKVDLLELASVPLNHEDIPAYLIQLVQRIDDFMQGLNGAFFEATFVEPLEPTEFDILNADGTLWDPGAGAGLYQYRSGAWVKL